MLITRGAHGQRKLVVNVERERLLCFLTIHKKLSVVGG
jgi:hypothetical protein